MSTRAEQKEARRLALLDGGVRVLADHGLEGFTTGRVAAEAGIAQSGLYKYWSDRDTALAAVAEHVGAQILVAIREARRAAAAEGQIHGAFVGGLEAILSHRDTVELALRYRRDPGPLGQTFHAIVERGRDELFADMISTGMVQDRALARRFATYTVGLTMTAVEALIDGEIDSVETAAADLTLIAMSVLGATA